MCNGWRLRAFSQSYTPILPRSNTESPPEKAPRGDFCVSGGAPRVGKRGLRSGPEKEEAGGLEAGERHELHIGLAVGDCILGIAHGDAHGLKGFAAAAQGNGRGIVVLR